MIYDLQKASMWKRISAFLCDMILFCIVAAGIAFLLSAIFGIDAQLDKMVAVCDQYAQKYELNEFMTKEELDGALEIFLTEERKNVLTEEQKETFEQAKDALYNDETYLRANSLLNNFILLTITFSLLAAHLILEFVIPLFFKNGQTVGKKIFGIGVMRIDGVKVTPLLLFVRTVLGKYAVETMIPVFVLITVFLGTAGPVSIIFLLILAIAQVGLLVFTQARTPLHDMLSGTVTVDFASQLIFETAEERLEYQKKLHAESVAEKAYSSKDEKTTEDVENLKGDEKL